MAKIFATHNLIGETLLEQTVHWDEVGNVDYRIAKHQGREDREDFAYDALNRLEGYAVNGGPGTVVTYNNIGNIQCKSDVGAEPCMTTVRPMRDLALIYSIVKDRTITL